MVGIMNPNLLLKAARQSKFLSLFNRLVLLAAILVYLGFAASIISTKEWFGFIPITSVLLGVLLIHIFVEVALNHFALLRDTYSKKND